MLKGYKIKVTAIDPKTARPLSSQVLGSDGEVTSEESILHIGGKTSAPVIVWTDKALKTLKVNIIGASNIETIKVTSKSPVEKIAVHAPSAGPALNHFLVHYQTADSHWAEVYHVDAKSRSVKKAYDLPVVAGKGAFSASALGANVFFTRTTETEASVIFSATHGVLEKWPLKRNVEVDASDLPELSSAVTEVITKGQSGYAVRSALMLSSGDLELIRNGESEWVRHESLAGITAAAWADVPVAENLAEELAVESHSNVLSAYIHRVRRHAHDLQYLPAWLQRIPARVSSSLFGGAASSSAGAGDPFGFRKIVVAATEKGRIVGIDAGSQGKVLWNVQAVQLPPGSKWNVTDISIENDLALVMARDAEFMLIETMTGKARQYQEPGAVENMDRFIPVSKGGGKRLLIPVLINGAPGSLPPGDATNNTFIVTQRWDGAITGWHVQDGVTPTGAWIFSPPEGERVAAVAKRPSHDPVASIGRALGDRNVLYKYLSTNLAVVAAVNDTAATASIYLLDTITGETLHSTSHEAVDTAQPISITFTENWFGYTLRTDPALARDVYAPSTPMGNLFIISELFESPIANDRGPLGSSSNFSSLKCPPHAPHVISASYVIPAPLTHLATTSTKQGITPRSILAYSAPLAALLAIPASMLSPRRPVGRDATGAEREEGLFPYSPIFDFNPQWTISHKRDILGIRGIVTTPTLMESSSLVFAYGNLDVFGTRIAPIGAFDLLGNGFNKAQLVLTVGALAVGTKMLAPLVRIVLVSLSACQLLTMCRHGRSRLILCGNNCIMIDRMCIYSVSMRRADRSIKPHYLEVMPKTYGEMIFSVPAGPRSSIPCLHSCSHPRVRSGYRTRQCGDCLGDKIYTDAYP